MTRRLGFRARLVLLGTSGILGALLVGAISLAVQSTLGALVDAQAVVTQALRNQLEADMMHDAIKADLYEALYARSLNDAEKLAAAREALDEHVAWFRRVVEDNAQLPLDEATRGIIAEVRPTLDSYVASAIGLMDSGASDNGPALRAFGIAYDELAVKMESTSAQIEALATTASEAATRERQLATRQILGVLLFGVAFLTWLAWWTTRALFRTIGGDPAIASAAANDIAAGNLETRIPVRATDTTSLMARLANMRDQLRTQLETERAEAAENLRLRHALDAASSATMIADAQRIIVFANRNARKVLKDAEDGIRKVFPQFSVERLVGQSIDQFHRNPAHQRDLLANLRGVHQAHITVGGHDFRLKAFPIFDGAGQRMGTTIDWEDCTAELAMQRELSGIVSRASEGDFGARVNVAGKEGFFLQLSQSLNTLLDRTVQGISEVQHMLHALGEGDLSRRSEATLGGVFAAMLNDANRAVHKLQSLMRGIQESADQINSTSGEIAGGNADLSARTEQQAASLEETAASVEQLTATVKQNAESAQSARKMSSQTAEVASEAGRAVDEMVRTMDRIDATARRVGDIISTIDGIAFQTNILALNAAVEAARAGEQGRGFAVVASEVRALAQRSTVAAKEIHTLIGESLARATEGSHIAHRAGDAMGRVVSSVNQVTGLVEGISHATAEQARGIEQVNRTIAAMDESTQQNAALVEQASAAASAMAQRAQGLREEVGRFRL